MISTPSGAIWQEDLAAFVRKGCLAVLADTAIVTGKVPLADGFQRKREFVRG